MTAAWRALVIFQIKEENGVNIIYSNFCDIDSFGSCEVLDTVNIVH